MKLTPEITRLSVNELSFELNRGGRLIAYQYCISLVVITFRRSTDIYLVKGGESAAAKGLPWTVLSLFLGWWGIPFGLIYTPMVLYKNLSGGIDVTQAVINSLQPAAAPPSPAIAASR